MASHNACWNRLGICGLALLLGAQAAHGGAPSMTWQRHRDAQRAEAGLLRYYTFEHVAPGTPIADLLGGEGALQYDASRDAQGPGEPLQLVDGRWPGKPALRLDQGFLVGPALRLSDRGFTLEGWFRTHGPGRHRGTHGATNGTLLALGNGYWEGCRLTMSYPQRTLRFEIGRPKPGHAEGINTRAVADNVWHHVAAAWNGRQLRIYVDGLPAAAGAMELKWTPPSYRQALRIGYANSGMGSVVLDVDEVAIFDHALEAGDVFLHAHAASVLSDAAAAHFRRACAATLADQPAVAEAELQAALHRGDLPSEMAATARVQLAQIFFDQKRFVESAAGVDEILAAPGADERQVQLALALGLRLFREAPGASLSAGTLQRLVASGELTPPELAALPLAEGHAAVAAGKFAAARAAYERVALAADAPPPLRSIARLHAAESCVREHDFAAAKAAYAAIAAAADVPPHQRWEAQQQIAALERIAAGLPARDPAAGHIQLPPDPAPAVTLYVAPNGSDANPGTAARPLATLERARDALRRIRQGKELPAGGAVVEIRGGAYHVTQPFELDVQDSGTAAAPIVYRAAAGETPRFSGGVRLTGFQPLADRAILDRLPVEARGKVLAIDLKPLGVARLFPPPRGGYGRGGFSTMELFCNGQAMQLPRWPQEGFDTIDDVSVHDGHQIHNHAGSKVGRFHYHGARPERWTQEKDLVLYGYWFWDWADSYERVEAIDVARHEFILARPGHNYGYRPGQRYYAVNVLAEMCRPGQWYLDRDAARLYFYPPRDPAQADVELSVADGPLVRLENVAHVRFQGLTWEYGCGNGILVRDGNRCLLAGCTLRHFAGTGVEIQGGRNHGILACDIYSMGRGGTRISGGDRQKLQPAGHFVENCHIYDLSRIDHTYTPAVGLTGVGSRIVHNLMHDIPSSALNVTGNEHLIELNEVFHVVQESDDQGGVDMFGDPTFRGNVYRYNYWHHIGNWDLRREELICGEAGIRLDDAISGTVIYGNVFYRCSAGKGGFGGVQIHGGKDNFVDGNLFVDCRAAISFSPWNADRWREYIAKFVASQAIDHALYNARYPELTRLSEDPNVNTICRNLVFGCGEFLRRNRENHIWDNAVTAADPGFADAAHGVFAWKAAAPSVMPQPSIPFAEIGLYRDRFRAQLPEQPVNEVRATPPAKPR